MTIKEKYVPLGSLSGGLNESLNPLVGDTKYATNAFNVTWDIGGEMKRRGGCDEWGAVIGGVTQTIGLKENLATPAIVQVANDGAAYLLTSPTGSWAAISGATGYSTTNKWEWADAYIGGVQGIVGTNGFANLATYDATAGWAKLSTGSPTQPDSAKHIVNFYDRILAGNVKWDGVWYPNKIYYSDLLDPTAWATANNIDFKQDEHITGMEGLDKYCFVFKDHSIYRLDYTPQASTKYQIEDVSKTVGAVEKTIQNVGDKLIFYCDKQGVYELSGMGQPQKISDPIYDSIKDSLATYTSAVNPVKFHYYLTNIGGVTLVWDHSRRIWTRFAFWNSAGFSVATRVLWGGAYNSCLIAATGTALGQVAMPDMSTKVVDEGRGADVSFVDYVYSPRLTFGAPQALKRYTKLVISGHTAASTAMTIAYELDGSGTFTNLTTTLNLAQTATETVSKTLMFPNVQGKSIRLKVAGPANKAWEIEDITVYGQVLGVY